ELAVALDVSASMTQLPLGGPPRYSEALGALRGPLGDALAGAHVRWWAVGAPAEPLAAPPAEAEGLPDTRLLPALAEVLRLPRGKPLRACLLVSDGADGSGETPARIADALAAYGVPVFCLGVGDPGPLPDISVAGLVCPRIVTEGDEFTLQALVDCPGYEDRPLQAALIEEGGATSRRELPAGREQRRLEIKLTAGAPGYHRYTLAAEELPGEVTHANNRRLVLVRVEPRQARLLLIDGRPRREYAFLRRLLLRYEDIEVVLVLRKAPDQFWLDAGTPRRLPGLSAAGEIERFRGAVLSDIEAGALGGDFLGRLAAWVRGGGALAMLGGEDSFGAGGYAGTPLAGLLPVRISDGEGLLADPLRASPTGEGELGRALRASGIEGWDRLPLLGGMNAVAGATAGAEVAVQALAGGAPRGPMVATCRAGAGRALAVTVADTYRWMQSPNASETSRAAWEALWGAVFGWLLGPRADQPVALELDRDTYQTGAPIRARVYVRDEEDQPVTGAVVQVTIEAGEERGTQTAEPTGTGGLYQALVQAGQPGSWRITATAEVGGRALGEDARGFDVVAASGELARGRARPQVLEAIAQATGGVYMPVERAEELAEVLPLEGETESVREELHPMRTAALLIVFLALAGADWLLRRRWAVG
ncbi:MAG TPA: FixH family protein, partial [Armatimonadota bacterium]|nr:FixH family protein [Armatimonadota bacterium]